MCGRFMLTTTNEELMRRFTVQTDQNYPNRWNIAPSQTSLTITCDNETEPQLNTHDIFVFGNLALENGLSMRVQKQLLKNLCLSKLSSIKDV